MRRSDPSKPPYISFCLSVRDSEKRQPGMLERCLASVRRRCPDAEIVIVDNLSSDPATIEVSKRWADVWVEFDGPDHSWKRDDPWTPDMAASRDFGFRQAHGAWRGWIDDDDELADPEEAERILRLNGKWEIGPSAGERAAQAAVDAATAAGQLPTLEDLLRDLEQNHPKLEWIRCPYAYSFIESLQDGRVQVWQEAKIRFVKWAEGKWKWTEAAHEDLVYADGRQWTNPLSFPRLLWVHHKKHTDLDNTFSTLRHFDVLHREYTAGRRTTRNALYLANYARFICPERIREFLTVAREVADVDADRARAEVDWGNYYAERGLLYEAKAAFGAAVQFRPDLPDSWAAGANAAVAFGDHAWAAEWWKRASEAEVSTASTVNPREWLLRYPILEARARVEMARQVVAQLTSRVDLLIAQAALGYYQRAVEVVEKVARNPAIGVDFQEVQTLVHVICNEAEGHQLAMYLYGLFDYLVRNDETEKASRVTDLFPHTLEDHPIRIAIEQWSRKITRHLTDPDAYRHFYASELTATDVQPAPEEWLAPDRCLPRAAMLADWLNVNRPDAHVLEVGSFDGVIGIPVLRAVPGIRYTAVDALESGLARFRERADQFGVGSRLTTHVGTEVDLPRVMTELADVAVFYEVIEHVPDPIESLITLADHVVPGGRIFLSTPWGAFDRGSPPATQSGHARDPRGHVRAMTLREFIDTVRTAGLFVEDAYVSKNPAFDAGHTAHLVARVPGAPRGAPRPLSVYVPGALWDWNGRHVEETGIGASEESIVYLADRLARGDYAPRVFGPVPEPEVLRGVEYSPRMQLRHVEDGPVIVSRAPSSYTHVDHLTGRDLPKVLWLQDAYYPDLTQVAAKYRRIVVLTEWHKATIHDLHGVPLEQMVVIPNFLLRRHFEVTDPPTRDPFRFIYMSSPDRGLVPLLKLWPEILRRWPKATLDIFYGFEGTKKLAALQQAGWVRTYRTLREEYEALRYQPGVIERGRVNHETIAREILRAGVWAYPTTFSETQCLNAVKARAGGAIPVTTPYAGLTESASCPQTRYVHLSEGADPLDEAWRERCLEGIRQAIEMPEEERQQMMRMAVEEYDLEVILPRWTSLLAELR